MSLRPVGNGDASNLDEHDHNQYHDATRSSSRPLPRPRRRLPPLPAVTHQRPSISPNSESFPEGPSSSTHLQLSLPATQAATPTPTAVTQTSSLDQFQVGSSTGRRVLPVYQTVCADPRSDEDFPDRDQVYYGAIGGANVGGTSNSNTVNNFYLRADGAAAQNHQSQGQSTASQGPSQRAIASTSAVHSSQNQVAIRDAESASDVYSRILLVKKIGFPLWNPDPSDYPPSYKLFGVTIGDVGVVGFDGRFDFFFNICLPRDHPRNLRAPPSLVPFYYDQSEVKRTRLAFQRGRVIASSSIRKTASRYQMEFRGSSYNVLQFNFTCPSTEGAILVLPNGASREDLYLRGNIQAYARRHVVSWHEHIYGTLGLEQEAGPLYLITGHDKCDNWCIASYSNSTTDEGTSLAFTPNEISAGGTVLYTSDESGPIDTNTFFPADTEAVNQCVFLRGYRLMLREASMNKILVGRVRISDIVDSDPESDITRRRPGGIREALSKCFSWLAQGNHGGKPVSESSVAHGMSGGVKLITPNDEPSKVIAVIKNIPEIFEPSKVAHGDHGILKHVAEPSDAAVVIENILDNCKSCHPADVINSYLLEKSPNAQFAMTHDNDLFAVIEEQDASVPEGIELIQRIEDKFRTEQDSGCVFLIPKDGTLVDSIAPAESMRPTWDEALVQDIQSKNNIPDNPPGEKGRRLAVGNEEGFEGESAACVSGQDRPEKLGLHSAVESGDYEGVKSCLDNGTDVNVKGYGGIRPLHCAVKQGDIAIVKLLLERGADVIAQNKNGETVLHWAVEGGHETSVRMLIENGANTTAQDNTGMTPLHWAVNSRNIAAMKLLIENGADIGILDHDRRTLLHYAAERGEDSMVTLLLKSGANVDAPDAYGETPLHRAIQYGNTSVARQLVYTGADVKIQDREGRTALHYAVKSGDEPIVLLLIQNNGGVKVKDRNGETALHWAVRRENEKIGMMLIEGHSDIDARDSGEKTPLHWAAEGEHAGLVSLLVANGANVKIQDFIGKTALHLAAESGNEEAIKLLVVSEADVNTRDTDGRTALHWAVERWSELAVKLLVENGADLNAKDTSGQTPLHCAAKARNESAVRLLLSRDGIDVNGGDDNDRTPMYWALANGDDALTRLLSLY